MYRHLVSRAALTAVVLLASAAPVRATIVRALDEAEMTAAAALIVRGAVRAVATRRSADGLPLTEITLEAERYLKADARPAELVVTQLGGTLDGRTLHVAGQSRYQVGERVLLFLARQRDGWVELGVGAGKYRVVGPPGQETIARELGGAVFLRQPGAGGAQVVPPAVVGEPLPLFEQRIAARVEARR